MAGSWGRHAFNFLRNCQTVFQSGWTFTFPPAVGEDSVLPYLTHCYGWDLECPHRLMCWKLGSQCSNAQRWGFGRDWTVKSDLIRGWCAIGRWWKLGRRDLGEGSESLGHTLGTTSCPWPLSSCSLCLLTTMRWASLVTHPCHHDVLPHLSNGAGQPQTETSKIKSQTNLASFWVVFLSYFVTATESWLMCPHLLCSVLSVGSLVWVAAVPSWLIMMDSFPYICHPFAFSVPGLFKSFAD
jgi:hypothetical protein